MAEPSTPATFYVNWGRNIPKSMVFSVRKVRERVIDLCIFRLCHFLCFDERREKLPVNDALQVPATVFCLRRINKVISSS